MCSGIWQDVERNQDSSDSKAVTQKTEDFFKKGQRSESSGCRLQKRLMTIYVQERTDKTDEQCKAAKEAWDKLTDAQKELVEGDNADPDYFGRDTGDASQDDPLNQDDDIGEKELLVVSFGTSFNDEPCSRYRWSRESTPGSKSGLVSKKSIYSSDHHQPCTGKRWRED